MKKIIILLCLFLLFFTSCAKNVKPLEKHTNDIDIEFNENFHYDTIGNIKDEYNDIFSQNYSSISLAKGLKINVPETAMSAKVHECEADKELAHNLINNFAENKGFKILDDEICLINEEINGEIMYLDKSGGFTWYRDTRSIDILNDEENNYFYLTSDYDDIEIKLEDGNLKLSQAVRLADKLVSDYCEIIGADTFVPVSAKCSNKGFIIYFTDNLDGYMVPDCYVESGGSNVNSKMFSGAFKQCFVTVTSCDSADGITDQTGCAHVQNYINEYSEIITLKSAINFLDVNMAEKMKCKIVGINLVQVNTAREKNKVSLDDIDPATVFGESNYNSSPCWQFIMLSDDDTQSRYYALIDCITGEFAFGKDLS